MLLVWIGIAIVAILAELFTPTALISIWFACGAVIASILAYFEIPEVFQITCFIVVSIASMFVIRPMATRYLRGNIVPTNADRLIGETGVVSRSIKEDKWGEVHVGASYWSAVEVNGHVVDEGAKVKILAIEGAKLIVKEI